GVDFLITCSESEKGCSDNQILFHGLIVLDFTKIIFRIIAAARAIAANAVLQDCTLESYHEDFCCG
ncbi:MAG: hypothetical protein II676_00490, partial [Bacteroidales bacterium]|nr:hypothetical protein [Bacteroidales bacterium]